VITLAADPSSNLDWNIEDDRKGIWHLDFGWKNLDPYNTTLFNSYMLALDTFAKRFPNAQKVVLACTNGRFSEIFSSSERIDETFKESGLEYELFCAKLFSEYLHRLASALPEDAEPTLLVDIVDKENFAELVLLFCKRRFEHFVLLFPNIVLPIEGEAPIAISLPQDELYNPQTFVELFQKLQGRQFKCIPEELLNEHWVGVDYLIVDPESLGPSGKRMLYGFEAAGGQIISTRGPLGFAIETSFEEFLRSE